MILTPFVIALWIIGWLFFWMGYESKKTNVGSDKKGEERIVMTMLHEERDIQR